MIYDDIQRLISYALKNELISQDDTYVIRNQLMEVFQLTDWQESNAECSDETIDEILAPLIDYACKNGIINDTSNSRDLFDTNLWAFLRRCRERLSPSLAEITGFLRSKRQSGILISAKR